MVGIKPPRLVASVLAAGLLFFGAGAALLFAFDWPLSSPRIVQSFGTAAYGGFATGLALEAQNGLVKSAEEGELAFVVDEKGGGVGRLPSTLGSYVVVEHPRGMVGVYGELAPGSASSYLRGIKKGSILGSTGASGWSRVGGSDFRLFDRSAARWVNPLLLLPPIEDKIPPLVRAAYLLKAGKSWPLGETKTLPQGSYTIAVDAIDPTTASVSGPANAPYYLRLLVDGVKVAELSFDVAEVRDGLLRISSDSPRGFEDCYSVDGKTLLAQRSLPRGRSVITVLVRDFAGNERQSSWAVNLE